MDTSLLKGQQVDDNASLRVGQVYDETEIKSNKRGTLTFAGAIIKMTGQLFVNGVLIEAADLVEQARRSWKAYKLRRYLAKHIAVKDLVDAILSYI